MKRLIQQFCLRSQTTDPSPLFCKLQTPSLTQLGLPRETVKQWKCGVGRGTNYLEISLSNQTHLTMITKNRQPEGFLTSSVFFVPITFVFCRKFENIWINFMFFGPGSDRKRWCLHCDYYSNNRDRGELWALGSLRVHQTSQTSSGMSMTPTACSAMAWGNFWSACW